MHVTADIGVSRAGIFQPDMPGRPVLMLCFLLPTISRRSFSPSCWHPDTDQIRLAAQSSAGDVTDARQRDASMQGVGSCDGRRRQAGAAARMPRSSKPRRRANSRSRFLKLRIWAAKRRRRIARGFSFGFCGDSSPQSPAGAVAQCALCFPSPLRGLECRFVGFPGAEAPGYSPRSLRDHQNAQLQNSRCRSALK